MTEKEFEFFQFSATGKLRERLRTALEFFERRDQGHIRYETPRLPAVGNSESFELRKLVKCGIVRKIETVPEIQRFKRRERPERL